MGSPISPPYRVRWLGFQPMAPMLPTLPMLPILLTLLIPLMLPSSSSAQFVNVVQASDGETPLAILQTADALLTLLRATPEGVTGIAFVALFPITFVASTFVPTPSAHAAKVCFPFPPSNLNIPANAPGAGITLRLCVWTITD